MEEGLAPQTNFAQLQLGPDAAQRGLAAPGLGAWLVEVGFPRHGLLVRPVVPLGIEAPMPDGGLVAKGLHHPEALLAAMAQASALAPQGWVQLETDMRAHCNPTRMASIRQLCFRLVRRLATPCPACTAPGWGRQRFLAGLPCACCGTATTLMRAELWSCVLCDHREQRLRADGLLQADPSHCPFCNP